MRLLDITEITPTTAVSVMVNDPRFSECFWHEQVRTNVTLSTLGLVWMFTYVPGQRLGGRYSESLIPMARNSD